MQPSMTPKRFLKLCAKPNGASDVADALGASPGLLHAADGTGNTGLHRAAAAGCVETAVLLADRGLAVDVRNTKGKVPMHEAALFGHVGVCEALVLRGSAAVRWAVGHSSEQWTPLMYAASRGHCATIAFLIDAGAAWADRNSAGCSSLYLACRANAVDACVLLLDAGADVNQATNTGRSPLHTAAEGNRRDLARLLVERGAVVNHADGSGTTVSHLCAEAGFAGMAQDLLEAGMDVARKNAVGRTCLHLACYNGHAAFVRSVLGDGAGGAGGAGGGGGKGGDTVGGGATVGGATVGGATVGCATVGGGTVDVDGKDERGCTALYLASSQGNLEECALLLDYGAKQLSSAKRHPLHCAAGWNHPAVVRLLLERGASVDVKDDKGATPLECAKNHNGA